MPTPIITKPYSARSAGSDGKPYVSGPGTGMGYDSGTLFPAMRLSTEQDAQAAALCCNEAYRIGYLTAQLHARRVLGIPD